MTLNFKWDDGERISTLAIVDAFINAVNSKAQSLYPDDKEAAEDYAIAELKCICKVIEADIERRYDIERGRPIGYWRRK